MKHPQRIIPSGLFLLFSLCLCGCGDDLSGQILPVEPLPALLAFDPASPCFQLGETVLYPGSSTLAELTKSGAVLSESEQIPSLSFSEDPFGERELTFILRSSTVTVRAKNQSDHIAPLYESVICSACFDGADACSSGGILAGMESTELTSRLGEPYLILKGTELPYEEEPFLFHEQGLIYAYTSRLDDMTLRFLVDRGSDRIEKIEVISPSPGITDPFELPDEEISRLILAFRKKVRSSKASYPLKSRRGQTETAAFGSLSGIRFEKIRLLTLSLIRDPKGLLNQRLFGSVRAGASSYLILQYSASLSLADGPRDVLGCIYLPAPILDAAGKLSGRTDGEPFLESEGVYESESALLISLLGGEDSPGLSDYSSMERLL